MARHRPPSQTWRTFLANHVYQIAGDLFIVYQPPGPRRLATTYGLATGDFLGKLVIAV